MEMRRSPSTFWQVIITGSPPCQFVFAQLCRNSCPTADVSVIGDCLIGENHDLLGMAHGPWNADPSLPTFSWAWPMADVHGMLIPLSLTIGLGLMRGVHGARHADPSSSYSWAWFYAGGMCYRTTVTWHVIPLSNKIWLGHMREVHSTWQGDLFLSYICAWYGSAAWDMAS